MTVLRTRLHPTRLSSLTVLLTLLALIPAPCLATVLHVPGDYSTVQTALNAAVSGDTVQVAPGRYTNQIITWPTVNGIALRGSGSNATALVGNGGSPVLSLTSGVIDSTTLIKDLHITRGRPGISTYYGSPKIMGCTIDSCGNGQGAGMSMLYQTRSVVIRQCTIAWNTAFSNGGGVFSRFGTGPIIVGSTIMHNSCSDAWGGGVFCGEGSLILHNNVIAYNASWSESGGGGGVCVYATSVTLTDNVFVGNTTRATGSGVLLENADHSVISGNIFAEQIDRVALHLRGTAGHDVTRNTFTGNMAGGMLGGYASAHFNNFRGNTPYGATGDGVQAQNNWWGDSSGPTNPNNPEGHGDVAGCCFVPWLTVPEDSAPPLPPTGVQVTAPTGEGGTPGLVWEAVPQMDIIGYRVYYDDDAPGYPYETMIDVGDVTDYVLSGLQNGVTYFLSVTSYDSQGYESWFASAVSVQPPVSGLDDHAASLTERVDAFPNPFRGNVAFKVMNGSSPVDHLDIFSVQGQLVRRLAVRGEQWRPEIMRWDGRDASGEAVPAGMYVVRLDGGRGLIGSRKFYLVR